MSSSLSLHLFLPSYLPSFLPSFFLFLLPSFLSFHLFTKGLGSFLLLYTAIIFFFRKMRPSKLGNLVIKGTKLKHYKENNILLQIVWEASFGVLLYLILHQPEKKKNVFQILELSCHQKRTKVLGISFFNFQMIRSWKYFKRVLRCFSW